MKTGCFLAFDALRSLPQVFYGVDLTVVRRRSRSYLGKSRSYLKGDGDKRSEKSAEAVVAACMERRLNEEESGSYVSQTCMASEAWATGAD